MKANNITLILGLSAVAVVSANLNQGYHATRLESFGLEGDHLDNIHLGGPHHDKAFVEDLYYPD